MSETFAHTDKFSFKYMKDVVNNGESVPIEVMRPVLKSLLQTDKNVDEKNYCAKCHTPWKLGLCRSRLLRRPKMKKNQLIKALLRKEQRNLKKLKQSEKMKLSLYRTQRNTLKVECLVCKETYKFYCSIPGIIKPPMIKEKVSDSILLTMEKKKKRRIKELNAGLLISSLSCGRREHLQKIERQEKFKGGKPSEIESLSQLKNLENSNFKDSIVNSDIEEPPLEKDVVQRLVETLPGAGISNAQRRLLVSEKAKTRSKEKDILNRTLHRDTAMNLKRKSDLGNFLSSLI